MSKETIKAKIAACLAGQGSMIDISGKLPEILSEILDEIPEGGDVNVKMFPVYYSAVDGAFMFEDSSIFPEVFAGVAAGELYAACVYMSGSTSDVYMSSLISGVFDGGTTKRLLLATELSDGVDNKSSQIAESD